MTEATRSEITGILLAMHECESDHREKNNRLFEHDYIDLHWVAVVLMRHQRKDHTLQPTAIVHEAFLRLVDQIRTDWKDRAHFFCTAALAMR